MQLLSESLLSENKDIVTQDMLMIIFLWLNADFLRFNIENDKMMAVKCEIK